MHSIPDNLPSLTIILSTHSSLEGMDKSGLLDRYKRLLDEYSKYFRVILYTSDSNDFSKYLNVEHHFIRGLTNIWGLRHLFFFMWLILQSPYMQGVVKVVGSNIPTLFLVKWLSKSPMVVTYQFDYAGFAELTYGKGLRAIISRYMEKLALKPADLILVTTPSLEAKIKSSYNKPTALIPNWVTVEEIHHIDFSDRDFNMILYAGRLHRTKGVNVLIEAVAHCVNIRPSSIRLVICGAGEDRVHLEKLSHSLQVKTEFQGSLPNSEILHLMSKSAIFVLPTLTAEGHPKALIEAMACGMACVVSDVEGNNDLIQNGKNGLIVPANNVDALSIAINKLLNDPALIYDLGVNAKKDSQVFDFHSVVSKEIQIFLSLSNKI